MFLDLPSTTVYTPVQSDGYTCESSVVVITERCQRLNPGSSPGSRTTLLPQHHDDSFLAMFKLTDFSKSMTLVKTN